MRFVPFFRSLQTEASVESGKQGEDVGRSFDQTGGTGLDQVATIAKTPQHRHARQTGATGGFEVYFGVAHVDSLGRLRTKPLQGRKDRVGPWFAAYFGTFADGNGYDGGEKALMQLRHGRLELVRHDGQAQTAVGQALQQGHDTLVGTRLVEAMLHIMGAKGGEDLFKQLGRGLSGYTLLHQATDAIPQEAAHVLDGTRGKAVETESMVDTGRQIGQRIEQGAVEVEHPG